MDQHLSPSSSLSKRPQQPRLGQDRASGCRVNPGLPHVGRDPRTGTSSCWLQGAPQQEAGDRCLSQESNPDMGIPGTTAHTCSSTSQNKKPDHRLGVDDTSTGHMALKNQPLAGTGVKLPWNTHHSRKLSAHYRGPADQPVKPNTCPAHLAWARLSRAAHGWAESLDTEPAWQGKCAELMGPPEHRSDKDMVVVHWLMTPQ